MTSCLGKCHCGQIEFTAIVDDPSHILCHCNACKQLGGTEYTLNQVVPQQNFQLTKGTVNMYTYIGDSGNPVHCYYCPNCTTHIYHHQTNMGPKYVVHTVLLDGSKDWAVSAEVYAKDKAKWQPIIADKDSVFEAMPPK